MENLYIFGEWEKGIFSIGLVNTLILAAIVAVVVVFLIKVINTRISRKLDGNTSFLIHLLNVIITAIGVTCVLMTVTPLQKFATSLLAGSGIIAVVLGLAAQESLGNVFSGMAIGVSKPFVIGDYVELVDSGMAGTVQSITMRHTILITLGGQKLVVPNSVLNKATLRISSHADSMVCNSLIVGISYESDIEKAINILRAEAERHALVKDHRSKSQKKKGAPVVNVRLEDFGESALVLKAFVWTQDLTDGFSALSDIRRAVFRRFSEESIQIPYPHRTVIIEQEPKHEKPENR